MKVTIIFHSVTGNTYLMAKAFDEYFSKQGHDTSIYRVKDEDWKLPSDVSQETKEHLDCMVNIPIATPQALIESDLILLGCPTYFGNVSGELKAFMDATAIYWIEAKLAGKKLAAFTSAGNSEGGGDLCLQAIHIYGHYMGLLSIPVPTTMLPGVNCPASGIIHYSAAQRAQKLDDATLKAIKAYTEILLKYI